MLSVCILFDVMLSIFMLSVVILSVVMLSVVMLSVVMLSVIMLSVVMLSVVVPLQKRIKPCRLIRSNPAPKLGQWACRENTILFVQTFINEVKTNWTLIAEIQRLSQP